MYDMFVYITMGVFAARGCLKWRTVESVHQFITELWQCKGKQSTFVCRSAYISAVSVLLLLVHCKYPVILQAGVADRPLVIHTRLFVVKPLVP